MLWVDMDYDISKTIPVFLPGSGDTPVFQKNSHLCKRFYLWTADNVRGQHPQKIYKNVLREGLIQHKAKQRPRPGQTGHRSTVSGIVSLGDIT